MDHASHPVGGVVGGTQQALVLSGKILSSKPDVEIIAVAVCHRNVGGAKRTNREGNHGRNCFRYPFNHNHELTGVFEIVVRTTVPVGPQFSVRAIKKPKDSTYHDNPQLAYCDSIADAVRIRGLLKTREAEPK